MDPIWVGSNSDPFWIQCGTKMDPMQYDNMDPIWIQYGVWSMDLIWIMIQTRAKIINC